MEHKGTKIIETNRLVLRPFTIADAEAMYDNWANDPEVTEHLTWLVHESLDVTRQILESWVAQYDNLGYYQWAITLKEEGDEPIGTIGSVGKIESLKSIAVGYCIGKNWWRKGIISEALTALIKFFFEEAKVNQLSANHLPANPNSGKVLLKCGFKYKGIKHEATRTNRGDIADSVEYEMVLEDYKAMDIVEDI